MFMRSRATSMLPALFRCLTNRQINGAGGFRLTDAREPLNSG
jgi:hypothetical protein